MNFSVAAFLLVLVGLCHGVHEERLLKEHPEHLKHFPIISHEELLSKSIDFFLKNHNRQLERECFNKLRDDESVRFVIDMAPSPSLDKVDKMIAESPVSKHILEYLGKKEYSPSRTYFKSVSFFIDAVTYDMKPYQTECVIYENGRKFYISGRKIDESILDYGGDFVDSERNLETLWPMPTKSVPKDTFLHPVLKNSLGHLTQLALWNRDNGLPTVLESKSDLKPVYTILITDGSSGVKLNDLVDDVSRTTVIDIGNRRFLNANKWSDLRRCLNVFSLPAPQKLAAVVDSCRVTAYNLSDC